MAMMSRPPSRMILCHKADGAVDDHHQLQAATLAVA